MVDWNNASGVADSDADELAFLIGLLSKSVNLYATHYIRQWRYHNRLRLSWVVTVVAVEAVAMRGVVPLPLADSLFAP